MWRPSLAGVCEASAAGRAEEILGRVAEGFRAMKDYTVRFEVAADEYRTPGSYAVRGGSYYLRLGDDAEVYSDGRLRYEVDNRRREVTVTEVNRASRNILDNPVRAFDFLGSEYDFSLEGGERRPRHGAACADGGERHFGGRGDARGRYLLDAARVAGLRLRRGAGRDPSDGNRAAVRTFQDLRPAGLRRLRVHRLPVRGRMRIAGTFRPGAVPGVRL